MRADRPLRAADVAYRLVDEEMVLVSAGSSRIYSLSPVGAFVWERADGMRDMARLVDDVCEEFDVQRERAEEDVRVFVEEMRAERLIAQPPEDVG